MGKEEETDLWLLLFPALICAHNTVCHLTCVFDRGNLSFSQLHEDNNDVKIYDWESSNTILHIITNSNRIVYVQDMQGMKNLKPINQKVYWKNKTKALKSSRMSPPFSTKSGDSDGIVLTRTKVPDSACQTNQCDFETKQLIQRKYICKTIRRFLFFHLFFDGLAIAFLCFTKSCCTCW